MSLIACRAKRSGSAAAVEMSQRGDSLPSARQAPLAYLPCRWKGTMAYQIGQAGLAFGAFFLCALRTRLVPRFLAALGVVGYVVHFTGAVAEIFGSHVSLVLIIPGALFDLERHGAAVTSLPQGLEEPVEVGDPVPR
ncbi:DUF4386 family protein [Micromonospora sp. ATA32]|nr:DUF4386 family protein [Micromonospora sp. ATA32]